MSRFSVQAVVVNYNAGDWLARSVEALLASDPAPAVTVYDNASSDHSLATLSPWREHLTLMEGDRNIGFGAACNAALADCDADAFLIVNPDCIVAPDCLGRLVACLQANPDAGIVGGLIRDPDGAEQRACRRRRPTPKRSLVTFTGLESLGLEGVNVREPMPTSPLALDAVSGALLLIRARCFRALGGFDPAYFLHCEDLDLFERARQADWQVWFHPGAEATHAKGVSQRGRRLGSERHKHRGMVRYFRQHLAAEAGAFWRLVWPVVIRVRFGLMAPVWWLDGLWRR